MGFFKNLGRAISAPFKGVALNKISISNPLGVINPAPSPIPRLALNQISLSNPLGIIKPPPPPPPPAPPAPAPTIFEPRPRVTVPPTPPPPPPPPVPPKSPTDAEIAARQAFLAEQNRLNALALANQAAAAKREEDRIRLLQQQAAAEEAARAARLKAQQAADAAAAEQVRILAVQKAEADARQLAAQKAADEAARRAAELKAIADAAAAAEAARIKERDSGTIYNRFDLSKDVVENQKVFLTTGLFSNTTNGKLINAATMSALFTSSLQPTESKPYYYETWNRSPIIYNDAEPQFSIAYGHRLGSGSTAVGTLNDSTTRAVYSQYRLLLLTPEDKSFTFKDGTSSDSVYILNFNRARILEKLDPGNWQLTLGQLSGSTVPNNVHTGSNVKIQTLTPSFISLIDDSNDTQEINVTTVGKVVNIVSGSITGGVYNPSAPHYYGLMYPDMGVIVLNDNVLNKSCSFNTVTGSNIAGDNAWKLLTSISGAFTANPIDYAFQARNSILRTSAHYFVRIKNKHFNFSNNPTFVTGSEGTFLHPTFFNDPTVYITTVGLYNDRQELLAVGKMSQAIQKSFANETLIKVRLDY